MSKMKMTKEELKGFVETFSELGMDIIRSSKNIKEENKEEILTVLRNQKQMMFDKVDEVAEKKTKEKE